MDLIDLRTVADRVARTIANGPIVPSVSPQDIRLHLDTRYGFTAPMALDGVIADVEEMLRRWQVQVTHPRYFGLFNPSVTPASAIADALVAMYNPQLATWRTSPAANEIERHTLAWLAAKFGLPASSSHTFTTGGAESNLSAVVAALTRAYPDYGERGLRSVAAAPAIYLTRDAHGSFGKIAHMTGLGRESLRLVASRPDRRMDVDDLIARVAADRRDGFAPLMAVATAGTTAAGAIDPLQEIADVCRAEDLWLHVDAAWGGAAVLSPRLRPHLAGIERADSIACDAHKWLSVPMGAGMFFCRHADVVARAFRIAAAYMPARTDGPVTDPYETTIQWSRRFIGLKLFLALAEAGESGYAAMIDRQARMGDVLRDGLRRDGWRIVNDTPLPLVCFTRGGLDARRFLAELHERQIAWMSEVRLGDGAPVVRACITSYRTGDADVAWVVREMTALAARQCEVTHEA